MEGQLNAGLNIGEMIAEAADIARAEIAENRDGATWIDDALYPAVRTTVTGRLRLTDGHPAGGFWVVLSTQTVSDVYTIHEPTYFVQTDADGNFRLPGIPPAWQPGTTEPGTYTLYAFAADGSVTDQYVQTGITVRGRALNLHALPPPRGDTDRRRVRGMRTVVRTTIPSGRRRTDP